MPTWQIYEPTPPNTPPSFWANFHSRPRGEERARGKVQKSNRSDQDRVPMPGVTRHKSQELRQRPMVLLHLDGMGRLLKIRVVMSKALTGPIARLHRARQHRGRDYLRRWARLAVCRCLDCRACPVGSGGRARHCRGCRDYSVVSGFLRALRCRRLAWGRHLCRVPQLHRRQVWTSVAAWPQV